MISDPSGTIVRSGESLWVASPDDRSVAEIDPRSLATIRRVDVDGAPARLAVIGDEVAVSYGDRDRVDVIESDGELRAVDLPCSSGSGLAAWSERADEPATLAVACPVDGRVVLADVDTGRWSGWVEADGASELSVTSRGLTAAAPNGEMSTWRLEDLALVRDGDRSGDDVDVSRGSVPVTPGRRASQLHALVAAPDAVVAGYQIVDSERAADPTDPADTGSYASILEGMARVEAAVSGWCPRLVSDVSRPDRSLAGPSALAVDHERGRLWVVGEFTGNVVVLDCAAPPIDVDGVERAQALAEHDVGVGARGIVLSDDGRTAWIDSAFDHAVVRVDPDGSVTQRVRDLGDVSLSPAAQEGRRQFHDATDVHLTPNRVVTCASCHAGAGDDGLAWRISTADIARKYRRTPPLWGLAATGMLHWDGQYRELSELTRDTVHELLGGDGLLVGTSDIAAYLASTPPPPGAWTDDTAQVAAGRELFDGAAACASCHVGDAGADGVLHDGLGASTDPDGGMSTVRTPRLLGLAARHGFLHDGSAPTLEDVLDGDAPHSVSSLTDEQRDALLAYLRSR